MSFHVLEDQCDGCVSLTEGHVGTVVYFAIFEVQAEDAFVVLCDERDGRVIGACDVVASPFKVPDFQANRMK